MKLKDIQRYIYKSESVISFMTKNRTFIVQPENKDIEKNLDFIIGSLKLLRNKKRRTILELCYNNPKPLSELRTELKSSNKFIWHSVQNMNKAGWVKIDKHTKEKHQPVYVTSLFKPSEITNAFFEFIRAV